MTKVRKYIICLKQDRSACFGGFGRYLVSNRGEFMPLWYERSAPDVFRFYTKSEARYYARQITTHKVKIVKLKKNEQVREEVTD